VSLLRHSHKLIEDSLTVLEFVLPTKQIYTWFRSEFLYECVRQRDAQEYTTLPYSGRTTR